MVRTFLIGAFVNGIQGIFNHNDIIHKSRKHVANDPKCAELGWTCVPLAVETYGNWGREAQETFSRLALFLLQATVRSNQGQ